MATTIAVPRPLVTETIEIEPSLRVACRPARAELCIVAADLTALLLPSIASSLLFTTRMNLGEVCCAIAAIMIVFSLFNLYPGLNLNPVREIRSVSSATATVIVAGVCIAFHQQHVGADIALVLICALGMLLTPFTRAFVRSLFGRKEWWGQPVFVIGDQKLVSRVTDRLKSHPEAGLIPVALFCQDATDELSDSGLPVFDGVDLLDVLARKHNVRRAIVASSDALGDESLDLIRGMLRASLGSLSLPMWHVPLASRLVRLMFHACLRSKFLERYFYRAHASSSARRMWRWRFRF